jgi:prepilin-type N-terminal cleavage/methylation domain-containing protein
MLSKKHTTKGFSLVEVIVVLGIVAILTTTVMSVYKNLNTQNEIILTAQSVVHSLRSAQVHARASASDSSWGVYVESGMVTVYKGAEYTVRDDSFDKEISFPESTTFSGLNEISFLKFTGLPQVDGVMTLTNSNESIDIIVNEKGMISY